MIITPKTDDPGIVGILSAVNVAQGNGSNAVRHESILLTCVADGSGAFEAVIPQMNGLPRWLFIKGRDGDTIDNGTLDVDTLWAADLVVGGHGQVTISAGVGSGGSGADSIGATSTTVWACPIKVKVAGVGANKKFYVLIVLRVGV